MSTFTASTSTRRACITAVEQALPGMAHAQEALVNGLNSQNIADFAAKISRETAPVADYSSLAAGWSDFQNSVFPGWERVLSASAVEQLRDVRRWVTNAESQRMTQETDQPHPADHVHDLLASAVLSAAEEVGRMEQAVVAEAAAYSLSDLGYAVQRADGVHAAAFEASRGHEKLLVVVAERGTVVTDHAGLSDGSCEDRQNDFVDAMSRHGVELDESARQPHRDPRGGSPITASARHRSPSLAHGAVAEVDQNWDRTGIASLFPREHGIRRTSTVRSDAR